MRGAALILVWAPLLATSALFPTPSDLQLNYMSHDLTMFMHFGVCTFAGCEQNCRADKTPYPAELFNPTALDADQWVSTAKALGASELCLTAHHSGGFALWPSSATNYSVAASPWKSGAGDVVDEFVGACVRGGVKPCFYIIPSDDCNDWRDSVPTFVHKQATMISELLAYGPRHNTSIGRLWFDFYKFPCNNNSDCPGGFPEAWGNITQMVRDSSPATVMLPGPDGCLNYGEGGDGQYPLWNALSHAPDYGCLPIAGDEDGDQFAPHESDYSVQNPGDYWFHHPEAPLVSVQELWRVYLSNVGRGSSLIVNVPPASTGLIDDSYVSLVAGVGTAVQQSFGAPVVEANQITGGCAGYENPSGVVAQLLLPVNSSFDAVVSSEDIALGQRIQSYRLEIQHGESGEWTALPNVHGLTVGRKVIDVLPDPVAITQERSFVRFVCTSGKNQDFKPVTLKSFGVYLMTQPV